MSNQPENSLPQNVDWAVYDPAPFTPNAKQYEAIEISTTVPPQAEVALRGMIAAFGHGTNSEPYWQLPRMGRACFTPVSPEDERVVSSKGSLGRSAGSESFRQLHEERMRAIYPEGSGAARLSISDEVNFITIYRPGSSSASGKPVPEVVYAMPEGYSHFGSLLREYRTSRELLEPVGVPAPQALALLRREVSLPWSTADEAKKYINTLFMERFNYSTRPEEGEFYSPYDRLDTGLLFRLFKGAVRPQDHYDHAIKGEWDALRLAMDAGVYTPEAVLSQFAVAAGRLAEHGIVHGQLYYDYQNLTMAGEVCDLELTVIAPSLHRDLAERFTATLTDDESRFGVEIMEEYESNLQAVAPDGPSAARSLLEQGYYLFDAAARMIDLKHRAWGGQGDAPGTVLEETYIDNLRQLFASRMARNMSPRIKRILGAVCRREIDIDNDFRTSADGPLLPVLRDEKVPTIYGWSNPSKPLNFYGHRTTEEDVSYIIDDFGKFAQTLLKNFD